MFNFRTDIQYRLQDAFTKEHQHEYESYEALLDAFMHAWNNKEFDGTLEMKLYDLFEAAEQASRPDEAAPIYEQILALEPDNVDAKRELIGTLPHKGQQIQELEALIKTLKKPRKLDWYDVTTRPYTRCLIDLANTYLDNAMYQKAIDTFTPVFHGDKNNDSDHLLFMMTACCGAANWDRGRKVFARYIETMDDTQNILMQRDVMLPMYMLYVFLALQCGESKRIRDDFAELLNLFEDLNWVLSDATRWNDVLEDPMPLIEYLESETNIDTESQDLMLLHMISNQLPMPLITRDSLLWQELYDLVKAVTGCDVANRYSFDSFLMNEGIVNPTQHPLEAMFEQFMEEHGLSQTKNGTTKKTAGNPKKANKKTNKKANQKTDDPNQTDTIKSSVDLTSPVYANLTTCQKKKLHAAGFTSFDDFGAVTKDEILSIKGIGQKAVDNLVANGVVFKKA